MKILLTGATGYIGRRLLPVLCNDGHDIVCCVRDKQRFEPPAGLKKAIDIIEVDFLDPESLTNIPQDIDAAYYLIHSMANAVDYADLERQSALNFNNAVENTKLKQVIYLSGIVNADNLSEHLTSRKNVEVILSQSSFHLTTFRAGIIIGSGSASFEIIRDLVEKLPVMIAPKWLDTLCQPIGVRDVIEFLRRGLGNEAIYGTSYDIGGPDILSYKEMLLRFAKFRKFKRFIYTVPVMTPKLSSYWLYFVTSTSYKLASSLVDSMKVKVVCRESNINELMDMKPENYETSLSRAFAKIASNEIISSWKDAQSSGVKEFSVSDFIEVPTFGCFKDEKERTVQEKASAINKLWGIGGTNGWYYANFLWKMRGYIDKLFGGVGLRRGRTNASELNPGDSLDFWRVLYADKSEGRLLLFAEMKLPGEAWLEFKFNGNELQQTATFRPHGLWGRLYWYAVLPFHGIVFNGMINEIAEGK